MLSTIKKLNYQKNSVPNICPSIFNDHYCSTAERLTNHKPLSSQEILKEIRSSGTRDEFYFCSVSLSEIDYAIHNLKNNKIDCDGIICHLFYSMLLMMPFKTLNIPSYLKNPFYFQYQRLMHRHVTLKTTGQSPFSLSLIHI